MTSPRRLWLAAAGVLAALLLAPAAVPAPAKKLLPPTNLRVAAVAPHSVTLAWDPAPSSGSFVYVIRANFGYQVGVAQTQTSYTWTRDMVPGRTYSFVMWAADRNSRSADSNTVTVTLPVDTTQPSTPVVSLTGVTHSTASLAWAASTDDDYTCCAYRVFANGIPMQQNELVWAGPTAVTVLGLAPGTSNSLTVVAVDPSHNASAPSAAVTATTTASTDTTPPSAVNLFGWDFGCETHLFWDPAVDDVDAHASIRYEIQVNGVLDGRQLGIRSWITYGTNTGANTFSVQTIDSSGNRGPISSITFENQIC